jgi:demethylmenaquinone methyltransferase/2-methoxy-6-polyprenyl-1,4-benzoquinol methylase
MASIVTGQKAAYDYLGGSIEKFPSGAAMLEMIQRNGFTRAATEPLTGGIATIYTGEKP